MREPRRESRAFKLGVELTIGVACALVLFSLVLLALNSWFPGATGLGHLVRKDRSTKVSEARLFQDAPGTEVARLTRIERDVQHRPPSSVVWSNARVGFPLEDRHAVQSYADSGATITFDEENQLELGEKTVIVVRKPRRTETWTRRASVLFMDGILRGRLGSASTGDLEIELLTAGGTVRSHGEGPEAEVTVAANETGTTLSVHSGGAELVWGEEGRRVSLSAGQMVMYGEDLAPGEPVPLPDAPRLIAPVPDASFRSRVGSPEVTFLWRADPNAELYRFEIARDPKMMDVAYDARLEKPEFVHASLGPGVYYWSVSTLVNGVPSRQSAPRSFSVETVRRTPELQVEFPEGTVRAGTFRLSGKTEPGCRVVIAEQSVVTDASGRFEHEIQLQAGYNVVVVQAIDAYGNTAFQNRTIPADHDSSGRTQ